MEESEREHRPIVPHLFVPLPLLSLDPFCRMRARVHAQNQYYVVQGAP